MAVIESGLTASPNRPAIKTVGPLRVDPYRREVHLNGHPVRLTRKEWEILSILATDPTRVFTREELYHAIWGSTALRSRTLDTAVTRLRQKLSVNGDRFVIAVWGVGYRLIDSQLIAAQPEDATLGRFLITETNEYLVEAVSEADAEALYLVHGPDSPQVQYVSTPSRMVQVAG